MMELVQRQPDSSGHDCPTLERPACEEPVSQPRSEWSATDRQLEDVWDSHGSSVYAMACALTADEAAATQAVTLGMVDLALSTDSVTAPDVRRSLVRQVYRRTQELRDDRPTTQLLPPVMAGLAQLAPLQRASLALCCLGGYTHREAAALLDVPPLTVAELLTAGLKEIAGFADVRTVIDP